MNVFMQDRETVVLPRRPDHTSNALLAKLSIVKVIEFTSQTLRSGVVVWSDDGPKGSALIFLRGAPSVIRDLVQPASVPADFNQVGLAQPLLYRVWQEGYKRVFSDFRKPLCRLKASAVPLVLCKFKKQLFKNH